MRSPFRVGLIRWVGLGYLSPCTVRKWLLQKWNCALNKGTRGPRAPNKEVRGPWFNCCKFWLWNATSPGFKNTWQILIGTVFTFSECKKCWTMGYLAAGPGKEGFNVYTFSDRVPIKMLINIWSFLKIHQSPTCWRVRLQGEYLVVCPILKKQSWSLLCSQLTVHRGNTTHVGEGALLSL